MDKETAIRISKGYLKKINSSNIVYTQVWMFGSWAKGNGHDNSDIDLAIVLQKNLKSFELDVKLMTLRTGEETLIEPHTLDTDDFNQDNPFVHQIKHHGIRIDV